MRHLHRTCLQLAILISISATTLLSGCDSRPAAPATAYQGIDGAQQTLNAEKGHVVLLNFWATSCTSCVQEMPMLVSTHQKYAAKGFKTVAVAMSYDEPQHVKSFMQSRQLPFTVALDTTGEAAKTHGVKLTPTSILIDKSGRIAKTYVGAPMETELHAQIEKLLNE